MRPVSVARVVHRIATLDLYRWQNDDESESRIVTPGKPTRRLDRELYQMGRGTRTVELRVPYCFGIGKNNMTKSLALITSFPSALRKDYRSWRPFINWVRRPAKRRCAQTPFMRKAIALDVIFIPGCERQRHRSRYQCQSVNGKGARTPARRRSGRDTDFATIASGDVYAEDINVSKLFRSSLPRVRIRAKTRCYPWRFRHFPPRLLGFRPSPRKPERDDLSL